LLANETETPPVGAVPLKVTVPVADTKLATLVGFSATEDRATLLDGVMVSAAVLLALL
jgi:NaMN:DMB phosphoribosyltransferase